MKVEQIATITNTIITEVLGLDNVLQEDLTNVVEIGNTVISNNLDNYVRALPDAIGRFVFVDRVYAGRVPSVVRDSWEYGAIMEKVYMAMPDIEENESWQLTAGSSVDQQIFYKPTVSAKFWNKRVTLEIPISITEKQVKSAFQSATQLNSFYSMIQTVIENTLTVAMDSLVMRVINSMIADTIYADYAGAAQSSKSGIKAVNLLYLYNNGPNSGGTPLTAAAALTTPAFLKFAAMTMANYIDRVQVMSTLFNIDAAERFTPADRMSVVLLSEFKNAAAAYLESDTFHNELVALPDAETVPYWQGSGTGYAFADTAEVDVVSAGNHTVNAEGILGVIFDRDALGLSNLDKRTTSAYNAKGEFWNEFHKVDCGLWQDTAENFVTFFIA